MVKVLIQEKENKFYSLEVKGHADSAPNGQDLVCAGVSTALTGAFNALKNPKDFEIKLEEGYAFLKKNNNISSHDEVVIETLIVTLKTIEESYGQFIKIKIL